MNQTGYIKRTDLVIRSHYLGIKTQIFEVTVGRFEIYCENFPGDFLEVKDHFDQSIKGITMPVELVMVKPEKFIAIVPSFDDHSFATYEGEAFTKFDLLNLLMGKFPNVYFKDVEMEEGVINIQTATFNEVISPVLTEYRFLNLKDRGLIMKFLEKMEFPLPFMITEVPTDFRPVLERPALLNEVQYIYAPNFPDYKPLLYEQRDEALWFDNMDDINAGKFQKDDFYFFNAAEYSSYVDYSSFQNIDIRNLLLLFQTVYVTPPYEKDLAVWLKEMDIKFNDFADLIKKGRIRLILIQPRFRYAKNGWFNEIFQDSPNNIISRRAVAAFVQHDIVSLADNYILKDFYDEKKWMDFLNEMKPALQLDPRSVYERLMWPLKAKRMSFRYLSEGGLLKTPAFGVNKAMAGLIASCPTGDLQFEFDMASPSVHLSNALNSIYFPFKIDNGYSDSTCANIMGGMLNMYRNTTPENIKELNTIDTTKMMDINKLNPVDLFEFDKYIPLQELEKIFSKHKAFPRGKRLFESLAALSPEDRIKKIDRYNEAVKKAITGKGKVNNTFEVASNIALDGIGAVTGFNLAGSVFSVLKIIASKTSIKSPIPEEVRLKIGQDSYNRNPDKKNIHFLTQINRVARLK